MDTGKIDWSELYVEAEHIMKDLYNAMQAENLVKAFVSAKVLIQLISRLIDSTDIEFDPIVEGVREKLLARSQLGIKKYGTTMARTDLELYDWICHAQEEAMDLAVYLERVRKDLADPGVASFK